MRIEQGGRVVFERVVGHVQSVSVASPLGDAAVSSVRHGRLAPVTDGDGWSVTLPLDVTDCTMVRP